MNCPPEIACVLLQIFHHGILAARLRGWQNNAQGAALEANHVHNLPKLLLNFSCDELNWYWESTRWSYIEIHRKLGNERTGFEKLWNQLQLAAPTLKSDSEIKAEEKRANA